MTDDEFRALVEQAHQVSELRQHPGWAVYSDYLNWVVMAPLKQKVLNDNGVTNIEEYRRLAGFLSGVHRALGVADELGKQVKNERDRRRETDDAA